jgi:MoaA/NifB/PqqE/SkfB family radical SAM enzyme
MPLLLSRNILEYATAMSEISNHPPFTKVYIPSPDSSNLHLGELPKLAAPETVHLAVTYRCNETCPDCYARRHVSSFGQELSTEEICRIIDALADNGAFQLAIGGGEPFVRTDLGNIARYAVGRDLIVHITTGQYSIMREWPDVLSNIKTLNVGIQSEKLIFNEEYTSDKLRDLVEYAANSGVGVNIINRYFWQHETFVGNVCGQCATNCFCGGCRIFVEDAVGSEPHCPLD